MAAVQYEVRATDKALLTLRSFEQKWQWFYQKIHRTGYRAIPPERMHGFRSARQEAATGRQFNQTISRQVYERILVKTFLYVPEPNKKSDQFINWPLRHYLV